LLVLERVHGREETVIPIGYELLLLDQPLKCLAHQFFAFPDVEYQTLVSTLPLPVLIRCSEDAPDTVRDAAEQLKTTRFWLFDITAGHPSVLTHQWPYVYDEASPRVPRPRSRMRKSIAEL